MSEIKARKFTSFKDFFFRLWGIFKGPTFLMAFFKTPARLRERIQLTVSMANNCLG